MDEATVKAIIDSTKWQVRPKWVWIPGIGWIPTEELNGSKG
jgi:hypothetical protein